MTLRLIELPEPAWAITCEHHDVAYLPCVNEEGWKCLDCEEPLGFRPDLDREHAFEKVRGLLLDFHESKLIYVSNGTMGDVIAENVASRCLAENTYDQQSILGFILADPNMAREHAAFWQRRADRYLMGGEPIRFNEQEPLFPYPGTQGWVA